MEAAAGILIPIHRPPGFLRAELQAVFDGGLCPVRCISHFTRGSILRTSVSAKLLTAGAFPGLAFALRQGCAPTLVSGHITPPLGTLPSGQRITQASFLILGDDTGRLVSSIIRSVFSLAALDKAVPARFFLRSNLRNRQLVVVSLAVTHRNLPLVERLPVVNSEVSGDMSRSRGSYPGRGAGWGASRDRHRRSILPHAPAQGRVKGRITRSPDRERGTDVISFAGSAIQSANGIHQHVEHNVEIGYGLQQRGDTVTVRVGRIVGQGRQHTADASRLLAGCLDRESDQLSLCGYERTTSITTAEKAFHSGDVRGQRQQAGR